MENSVKIDSTHKISIKAVSLTLAITFSIAYVSCLFYGLAYPTQLHIALFETLPFFRWLTPASFLIGLIEFFIVGLFYGAVAALIYNYLIKTR